MPMLPLIPIAEAARLLGVSRSTLYGLCTGGKIPHIKLAGCSRVLFRPEALESWILAQEVPAGSAS